MLRCLVLASLVALSNAFQVPLALPRFSTSRIAMSGADAEATRDPEPTTGSPGSISKGETFADYLAKKGGKQSFNNDMDGWKPPGGSGGDAHACGGEYTPTDTPDFMPEEGSKAAAMAAGISFTDGMQGSQVDPNRKKSTGPELAGALDSNPDIYVPEALEVVADASDFVLPEPSWNVNAMAVTNIDGEFDFFTAATESKSIVVPVKPVTMTFEDFYCGFTADSDPSFNVSPGKGTMERRNGPPTELKVTCNPQGKSGDLVGYLCVILPEEKDFSTFWKITCTSR